MANLANPCRGRSRRRSSGFMADILIREIDTLADYAGRKCDFRHCFVQGLDLRAQSPCLGRANVSGAVFLGRDRYFDETGLFPMLQKLAAGRDYADLLFLSDEPEEEVEFISAFKLGELA